MRSDRIFLWMVILALVVPSAWGKSKPASTAYQDGLALYQAGRLPEATEAFNRAVQKKDHTADAQKYLERIRRETVERIRNKALVGDSKLNWRNKYFYIRSLQGNIQAGVSVQEVFEKDSLNLRPGAADALVELSDILRRSDNSTVEIELVNEHPQDPSSLHSELVAQQITLVFSFLSLATHDQLPR